MECPNCDNEEMEFDTEWAKFCFSDDEEIISVYTCLKCGRKYYKRDGNFTLEDYD